MFDDNPLFAALQENFGLEGGEIPDDPTTLPGLIGYCRKWAAGDVATEELNNPCLAMSAIYKNETKSFGKELANSKGLHPFIKASIEALFSACNEIAEITAELPQLAHDGAKDEVLECLEDLEEANKLAKDTVDELKRKLGPNNRQCLQCGFFEEAHECPNCRVVLVYPVPPGFNEFASNREARLRDEYFNVNQRLQSIANGRASLTTMVQVLRPLRTYIEGLLQTRQSFEVNQSFIKDASVPNSEAAKYKALLGRISSELENALQGVERMESAQTSFQLSELFGGWSEIYSAALVIEKELHELRVDLGQSVASEAPEAASSNDAGGDSVMLSS